jgi:tetratricopeptide (TPR) repeat protein
MKLLFPASAALAVLSAILSSGAFADPECGSLENAYGPFDYRTSKPRLHVVEAYHFTADVEALRSGNTSSVGGDIDYTLRASPNHHRALNAMMNLAFKERAAKPRGAHYTVDCYFDRAIRFAPNDGEVKVLYGVYLARTNRKRDAVVALEDALKYEQANPNAYYNLGLVYFDLKNYPEALKNAQRAYQLGSQLPGLRDKLKAAGEWREPAPRLGASDGSKDPSSSVPN